MTAVVAGLKPIVIPDSEALIVGGATPEMMALFNSLKQRIDLIAAAQQPVIPDPPDPPTWEVIETKSVSGVTDFVGLAGYQSVAFILQNMTALSTGFIGMRASTDNGSTFKSASGDYYVAGNAKVDGTEIPMHTVAGAPTASIYGYARIDHFSLAVPKPVRTSASVNRFIATTTALNAVRFFDTAGTLTSAGSIIALGLPGVS